MAADTTQGTGLGAANTTRGPDGGNRSFYAGVDVLRKLNDLPQVLVNENYTLQLTDSGKHIYVNGNYDITIPLHSSVTFEIGTTITVVAANFDVYFNKANNTTILMYGYDGSSNVDSDNWAVAPYGVATLLKVDQNTWQLFGPSIFID